MPRSLHFHRDILGLSEVEKSGRGDGLGWAWLRHGSAELMLNTAYEEDRRPSEPDPGRNAVHGDTILFLGCQDLDEAYSYLVARGVEAEPPTVRPHGMTQVNAIDPDGYGLCFQWPTKSAGAGG